MKKYKFKATIEEGRGGGAFVFFPHDVEKEFGTRGRVPVKVTFDRVPYTGSMMKYGSPQHVIGIGKEIREQLGKRPGDAVNVVLWRDEEVRTVEVPPEFKKRLEQEKLMPIFEKLSYTHRKEYCRWITEAKREETRMSRLARAIQMLKQGIKTPG